MAITQENQVSAVANAILQTIATLYSLSVQISQISAEVTALDAIIPLTQNVVFWGVISSLRGVGGGTIPRHFGLVLENQCGFTITGPAASYTPVTDA